MSRRSSRKDPIIHSVAEEAALHYPNQEWIPEEGAKAALFASLFALAKTRKDAPPQDKDGKKDFFLGLLQSNKSLQALLNKYSQGLCQTAGANVMARVAAYCDGEAALLNQGAKSAGITFIVGAALAAAVIVPCYLVKAAFDAVSSAFNGFGGLVGLCAVLVVLSTFAAGVASHCVAGRRARASAQGAFSSGGATTTGALDEKQRLGQQD